MVVGRGQDGRAAHGPRPPWPSESTSLVAQVVSSSSSSWCAAPRPPPPRCRSRWAWGRCLGFTLAAVTLGGALPSSAGPFPFAEPGIGTEHGLGLGLGGRTCEPIRVELCRSAVRGYNMTTMPNLAGHEFQKEAEGHLSTFAPLVQYGCSKQLLIFLCAVLVPMCTDQVDATAVRPGEAHVVAIGPCRGLCEAVRGRCLPVLQNFSYPWPPQFDCAKFPPHNSPAHMCMEGPGEDDALVPGMAGGSTSSSGPAGLGLGLGGLHPATPVPRCAEPTPHFSRADKQMAEVWLSIWSGLCFVSSVLALLTLRLGPGPGAGPPPPGGARSGTAGPSPLASLALSYGLLSVGWGTRVLAGRASSSAPVASASPGVNPIVGTAGAAAAALAPGHLAPDCDASDLRNPNCAAVFLLTYYFGTASIIWWVVLTAVWFLSAGLRMSPSSLQRHSYLFHLAGWGVPAALTLGVLVLRDVAADPLTGTCQVGPTWSTVFVLAPQCAFLCMGLLFLALGALTQWRSKPGRPAPACSPVVPAPPNARELRDLLWPLAVERLGLLAAVCAVPLAILVGTHALQPHALSLRLFQVRLVASLVVGVTAPFWVWPGERPWPPCPPWPRPPRAWRYPGPGKGGATTATSVSASAAASGGPTSVPLLGGALVGAATSAPGPGGGAPRPAACSALLGPPLPAPTAAPGIVAGVTPSIAVPSRSRSSSASKHRGERGVALGTGKHYRKHHGSETTV